jgi:predicted methyltransferase
LVLPAFIATAQRKSTLDRQLDIFWKAKHLRANAIARAVPFSPGDTVADIGTADGWFVAALSAYTDSITFFLEDIDSAVWSRARFDSAVNHFSAIRQKKSSHQFHYVKGTEKSTGLIRNTFHKALIIDTYHHFSYRDEMIDDVASLLKPGGRIIVLEEVARKPGDIHHGCRKPIYAEDEIIHHMEAQNMKLESVTLSHKVAGRKNKLFVFVKE